MGSNPNALPQMYVRGRSGIGTPALDESLTSEHALKNDPNQPIFMLDGYEVSMEKIYDLDIERIETYTILKDAAATAMYGSRAANGVVVITTKPLPAGRLNVTYSGNFTINAPDLSSYNLMNAREKLEAERLAGYYDTDDPSQIATKLKEYNGKLQNIERGIETDWLALPLRTSFGHKHSIGIAGASDAFRYGLDLMYDDQEGVMKGQNRKKMSAALNLQYQYKGLTFRNQMTTTLVNSQESPYGTFSDYVRMNPYDTYLDENGNIGMNMATWHSGSPYRNPMYDATLGSFDKGKRHEFYDQFDVRYYLNKKINFKANVALGYIVSDSDKFTDPAAAKFQSTEKKGQLTTSRQKQSTYDISLNGYYNDQIGRHNINFVVGLNIREEKTDYEGFTYSGFPEGGFSAPGYAKDIDTKSYLEGKNRLFGALAVLNYSYNDVIFADLSGRIDGSSQFGSNKRFAPFFSTGAGVNVHNLKFFKENTPWLTQFKLRGTYGMTGKVSFPSYAAQNKYEMFTDWQYPTGDGVQIMYLGNPNLKWERTLQTDLGFEFEILKGLFYAKYNYYIKDTHDNIADMVHPDLVGLHLLQGEHRPHGEPRTRDQAPEPRRQHPEHDHQPDIQRRVEQGQAQKDLQLAESLQRPRERALQLQPGRQRRAVHPAAALRRRRLADGHLRHALAGHRPGDGQGALHAPGRFDHLQMGPRGECAGRRHRTLDERFVRPERLLERLHARHLLHVRMGRTALQPDAPHDDRDGRHPQQQLRPPRAERPLDQTRRHRPLPRHQGLQLGDAPHVAPGAELQLPQHVEPLGGLRVQTRHDPQTGPLPPQTAIQLPRPVHRQLDPGRARPLVALRACVHPFRQRLLLKNA